MNRPLPSFPTASDEARGGGEAGAAGPVRGWPDASGELAEIRGRIESLQRQSAELLAMQAALREQIAALQAQAGHLGHVMQQIQGQGTGLRLPHVPLPLPLARLRELVVSPAPSFAFLRQMVRLDMVKSTRLHRDPGGAWRPRLGRALLLRSLARDFSALMFGRRAVVYRIRPRHAPVPVRPRVLHVIPNVFVGGSTQLVVDLHERLGHRYDMQVVTAALPPNGRHEGMVLHHLPLGSPSAAFASLLDAVRPEIVHLHYWGESDRPWYEAALAAARSTSAILLENVNTPVEPLRDAKIHSYLFVSQYIRDTFAPDIANGRVIHPGIDLDRFRPPAEWAPDAADTIGMVYRLAPDKLDAASIDPLIAVALRRPRTRIVVVGDGELLPVFFDRVREAGVRANFEFSGTVPFARLPETYRRFRIFVAPVVRESFGQVTPFAMATGQAVAGFRVGALPEILGTDETLRATAPELADLLLSLLEQPERTAAIGRANAARARRFGLDGMIRAYAGVYSEALERPADVMPGFPPAEFYSEV